MKGPHTNLSSSSGPNYATGFYLWATLLPPEQPVAFSIVFLLRRHLEGGYQVLRRNHHVAPNYSSGLFPSSIPLYLASFYSSVLAPLLSLGASSHRSPCWPTVSPAYIPSPSKCLYLKIQPGHFMEGLKKRKTPWFLPDSPLP